ncbi:MAG: methyl-accepting chemotaxis protein [Pseudomonadota bacterium]
MKFGGKRRLYFFFLLLFLLSGAITSYALMATKQFTVEVRKVSQHVYPATKIAIELKGRVTHLIEKFNVSRAGGTESELVNIETLNTQILDQFSKLSKLAQSYPEGVQLVAALQKSYQTSYHSGLKMIVASVNQEYEEEAKWTGVFDKENKNLIQTLVKIEEESSTSHNEAMSHVLAVSKQLNKMLLFSIGFLVVIGGIIFYMISLISRQIDWMGQESTNATQGLLEAIDNINAMSVQLAIETSSSSSSIDNIVSTMGQMSHQAGANLDAARTAESATQDLYSTANRSSNSIRDVVDAMKEMVEADREISSLVKVIEEIAFQTNLLALNAAVEAARAGEAGAGFAVVASEVRNLAMRTAETSRTVAAIIKRLDTKVTAGVDLVDNLKTTFAEVNTATDSVVRQMGKILETGKRQSKTEEKIRQSVNTIDDMVQSQAAMSQEASATVQEVTEQVERLHLMINNLMLFWEGTDNSESLS